MSSRSFNGQNLLMLIILYKKIFGKGYSENFSREIFVVDSVLKANPWTYKVKDVSGEIIFYEKQFLLSML